MKLLIAVSVLKDIGSFIEHYQITFQKHPSLPFIHHVSIMQHEVDILETGVGVYQTTYKTTKVLAKQKYHLALKVSFGNAYKEELALGSVLNIVNEKPGDYGMMIDNEWKDHYDFGLMDRNDIPHIRGGFINMNTSYMNVFAPFKKVVSLTVNNYADASAFHLKRDKYKADCETGDGLGFVYPCLYEKQNYYHLCVVERNLASARADVTAAAETMNETLIDLLGKL
jgi:futalosine hydrolase